MIKKLSKYIKQYKRVSILAPVFITLEVILEIFIPFFMAEIIDNGLNKGDMQYVTIMGAVMLVTAMCSLVCGVIAGTFAATASTGYAKNLRQAMFENIQNFSFSNLDKYSTAGLVTRMTTDITNVQNAYQMILRMSVRAPIMLILALIMSAYINLELSVVFFGATLFLGFMLFLIVKKAFPTFTSVFKRYDDLNASVQENLTGMRVVKAYVREDYEIKKFKKASEFVYRAFLKAERIVVWNMPIMQFTMYTCILLLSYLGAKSIVSGSMTTGQLMSFFTYAGNILMSLMMISMVFVLITMAKSSAERIEEVLDEQSALTNKEDPVYEVKDGSISFENVDFSYANDPEKLTLEGFNLKIPSGATVGVLGGTGCGKSSFVQLIPRLYDVTRGSVKVGGIDVREYDLTTLRNQVAMVLQKNVLFSGTITENLRWGNQDATLEEIQQACKQACAHEFIQGFPKQYDTYIEQGGNNVSGGQKQRLCIARALLKSPKILILDDSTSAVDMKTEAQIRKAFKEEIPNTTKLIIAQRISSVCDADLIIVLNDGRIDAMGNHEQLLADNDIYREVYESQTKGGTEDEA